MVLGPEIWSISTDWKDEMDAEDFKTLGDCDFGTIWEVQSENKVVVNAHQAALYFTKDEYFNFAHMVEQSLKALSGKGFASLEESEPEKSDPIPEVTQITDIQAFRKKARKEDDDGDSPG